MEQAQPQSGRGERSPDPFMVIPEEIEGQWRAPPTGETNHEVDEGHGHGKKSMLNKMKDKAKTLRTKVKKSMAPSHGAGHEENHGESQEESLEASSEEEEEDVKEEHQTEEKTDDVKKTLAGLDSFGTRHVLREDNKSSVQNITAEKDPHISSNKEEMPTEEILNLKTRGVTAEATESTPDEPGKTWNQRSSEGADRGKENLEEFGVHNGTNSPEKPGEEQFQSPGGKVKETPEKAELGKSWSETAFEGLGFAKEKLQGYGVFKGTKSAEKPAEESQSSLGNAQDKVSEIGEGKVMSSDKNSPNYTEEIKTGTSETGPGYVREASILADEMKKNSFDQTSSNNKAQDTVIEGERKENEDEGIQQQQSEEGKAKTYFAKDPISSKLGYGGQTNQEPNLIEESKPADQIQGKEMDSDQTSPNYTEDIKTGPTETGPGYVREASILADEMKKNSFDQTSSNNKAQDTVIEGERKENEDEGTQQQQSEGEGKAGQSYVSKIYSAKDAISSKLGYGGQTNQEPNVIEESKPADQIQGKEMDSDQTSPNYTEDIKTGPSETGPGYVREASILAEDLKKVLSFDQTSSNNKAKDTVIEAERKENENEGTQQQQSGGEGKAGQSYASKIFSAKDAISSKLGYGGQTNQEPNVIGESKPADQIQRTATGSMEGAKDSKETFKSTIVSKLSPGEDHKALSDVITEAVSNSAKSLKDSIGGLYGGNGKASTTDTNIGAPGSNNRSPPISPSGGKGIVDRVTGVVGSFLGKKQGGNSEQHSSSEKSEPKSQVQVEEQMPEVPKF